MTTTTSLPPKGPTSALVHPHRTILKTFILWKLFLLFIAIGSTLVNDRAYDTSADLLLIGDDEPLSVVDGNGVAEVVRNFGKRLVTRFNSWDAIYFVSAAKRGYVYEQEWAFGTGLVVSVRGVLRALQALGIPLPTSPTALAEATVAVLLSNASHLLASLVLYHLTLLLPLSGSNSSHQKQRRLALLTSLLHIFSPAGLFLSAPYAESSCALFSFLGWWFYARSCLSDGSSTSGNMKGGRGLTLKGDINLLLAGVSFGVATLFRTNGILNGLPFAWEVLTIFSVFITSGGRIPLLKTLRRLFALGLGGVLVALGSIAPQTVAWLRYCPSGSLWLAKKFLSLSSGVSSASGIGVSETSGVSGHGGYGASGVGAGVSADGGLEGLVAQEEAREWCAAVVPSIYTFVQEHYWNVGFLRYWTLPNIPLFLLATPMLTILVKSALDQLRQQPQQPTVNFGKKDNKTPLAPASGTTSSTTSGPSSGSVKSEEAQEQRMQILIRSAAAEQVLLAVLAVSTYHVQIITRISSGYPLWYWWLTQQLVGGDKKLGKGIVVFMAMYAAIQGVLFTSFLPPA